MFCGQLIEKDFPVFLLTWVAYLLRFQRPPISCSPWAQLLAMTMGWRLSCQSLARLEEEELPVC